MSKTMELIRGLHNLKQQYGSVVTIGNFDGVHRGHQAILNQLKDQAEQLGLPSVVVLFEPQPREFFDGQNAPARLTSLTEKLDLLKRYDVDKVLCLHFNRQLRAFTADEFIQRILLSGLAMKHLVVGDDFRFGCDRRGNFQLLKEYGEQHGVSVASNCSVLFQGKRISSTWVRQALQEADFELAAQLLGRPYAIQGRVIRGQQLGRTLGVPTANIALKRCQLPLQGVYAVKVHGYSWHPLNGVANIGWRPTVVSKQPMLETHLLDFSGDLYRKRLAVEFVSKLRDEQKFSSINALREAIEKDIVMAQQLFHR
ncbi:bifunctional riboflavin kinase/FAD synthetase [Zooshikella ganghwensis]|uniref:bifunctional riboflavin kinase/FAD synthetase n=1 Tax=Zooshikella ganghwensis TaxID=202772 RepID=UPI001E52F82F|nr:bifunctional riboflavin kinase/FAD synthetase [Zooshikella ganghwensis]